MTISLFAVAALVYLAVGYCFTEWVSDGFTIGRCYSSRRFWFYFASATFILF